MDEPAGACPQVSIRPVEPWEGEGLREIAIAAKAHWGYDRERVRRWAAMGDFSARALRRREIYVAEVEGRVVGWTSLIPSAEAWWLDDLWVEPDRMGQGVGSLLFRHAFGCAKRGGATRIEWEAEPNAVEFYENKGARHLRDGNPSEWGRVLPVMGIDLV